MIFRGILRTGYMFSKNVAAQRAKQLLTATPAAAFSQMYNRNPNGNIYSEEQTTQISRNVGLNRFLNR